MPKRLDITCPYSVPHIFTHQSATVQLLLQGIVKKQTMLAVGTAAHTEPNTYRRWALLLTNSRIRALRFSARSSRPYVAQIARWLNWPVDVRREVFSRFIGLNDRSAVQLVAGAVNASHIRGAASGTISSSSGGIFAASCSVAGVRPISCMKRKWRSSRSASRP